MKASDLVTVSNSPRAYVKISKSGAGYVLRSNTDYRCCDCLNFIDETGRCRLFGVNDGVRPNGTCVYWAQGVAPEPDGDQDDLKPEGSYSLEEAGYTEDPNGTKCCRCEHFHSAAGTCDIVEGWIDPEACCANQAPDRERGQ